MRKLFCIQRHGRRSLRVFIGNQRLHHGVTGIVVALACLAIHRPKAAAIGAVLILHDIRDWRIWFAREFLD